MRSRPGEKDSGGGLLEEVAAAANSEDFCAHYAGRCRTGEDLETKHICPFVALVPAGNRTEAAVDVVFLRKPPGASF